MFFKKKDDRKVIILNFILLISYLNLYKKKKSWVELNSNHNVKPALLLDR